MDTLAEEAMLEKAVDAANFLKIISHPHRLMILCSLIQKEHSVSELTEIVGIAQTAMSNHLSTLRETGLVKFERQHRVLMYSVCDDRVSVILGAIYQIFCKGNIDEHTH